MMLDYSKTDVPANYTCTGCGFHGGKLWRQAHTFADRSPLFCAKCAAADQKKDIDDMDADGRHGRRRTDCIGWFVPAVPTEENDTFWGYTSVPEPGVLWWRRLPNG